MNNYNMIEQTLTYNTPNSEQILRKINQYEFKRIWKNNLLKNQKRLVSGIFFLAMAVFMIFYFPPFGYFLLGIGLIYIINFFDYFLIYKKHKREFENILIKECNELKENSKDVIWKFTPTHFSFKNYKSEYKYIWDEITYCILDNQYLHITASNFMTFILDKANVDKDNLDKTIQYLEKKSKFKEIP